MMKNNIRIVSFALAASVLVGSLSSCYHSKKNPGYEYAPNMYHPIAYNPDQPNTQFKNGQTAQKPVDGTNPIGFHKFAYENTMDGYLKASAELVQKERNYILISALTATVLLVMVMVQLLQTVNSRRRHHIQKELHQEVEQ